MSRYVTAVITFAVAIVATVQSVQAQEGGSAAVVEAFYCNLQEGKTMKDAMQAADRFAKWADKNDSSYSAWILTPQFALGSNSPQMIWLGSNPNGNDLGKGMDAWQSGGGEVAAALNAVMDCSMGHVLASSVEINAPDGPPGDGVVMFSECSYDDDGDWMKAIKAHKTFSAEMRKMGAKNSNWLFFPMLGGGNPDYDYLGVSTFNNWSDYFAAYEMYVNGGGWQKMAELMDDVASCNGGNTPTVWDVKLVRNGAS